MEATNTAPIPKHGKAMLPYPPSIIDRFMHGVQRLPIPYWLVYLLLFLLEVLVHHALDWMDGSLPLFHFRLLVCFFPFLVWGPLAMMTYLDISARHALAAFSPLLDVHPETMRRLEYEFTTMPARGVLLQAIVWTFLWAIFSFVVYIPVIGPRFNLGPATVAFALAEAFLAFNIPILYHTVRQLRLVNRTVKLVRQFDLFRLDVVYAFSVLTARTGVAWLLFVTFALLIAPIQLSPIPLFAFLCMGMLSALAAFALPLWVVHWHLVVEKRKLMAEYSQRLKTLLARLHHAVDENEPGDLAGLHDALEGLNIEGGVLEKIRTWPWSAGTLTGFLSAIVLPMVLFFVQLVIQRWLGG